MSVTPIAWRLDRLVSQLQALRDQGCRIILIRLSAKDTDELKRATGRTDMLLGYPTETR